MLKVYITGERITEESAAHGGAAESGWVDPQWSTRDLFPNKEDVRFKECETLEEAEEWIESTIGSIDSVEDGTYYSADVIDLDYQTGDSYRLTAHVEEA